MGIISQTPTSPKDDMNDFMADHYGDIQWLLPSGSKLISRKRLRLQSDVYMYRVQNEKMIISEVSKDNLLSMYEHLYSSIIN